MEVLGTMQQQSMLPNAITYIVLISTCEQGIQA